MQIDKHKCHFLSVFFEKWPQVSKQYLFQKEPNSPAFVCYYELLSKNLQDVCKKKNPTFPLAFYGHHPTSEFSLHRPCNFLYVSHSTAQILVEPRRIPAILRTPSISINWPQPTPHFFVCHRLCIFASVISRPITAPHPDRTYTYNPAGEPDPCIFTYVPTSLF